MKEFALKKTFISVTAKVKSQDKIKTLTLMSLLISHACALYKR